MHCLYYDNLPASLSNYCVKSKGSRTTRYMSNKNFVLPPVRTLRGQSSIKFAGPKAWSRVPVELKNIAFKKPFSKKMKDFILKEQRESNSNLPENLYLKKKKQKATEEKEKRREMLDFFNETNEDFILIGFDQEHNAVYQENDITWYFGTQ